MSQQYKANKDDFGFLGIFQKSGIILYSWILSDFSLTGERYCISVLGSDDIGLLWERSNFNAFTIGSFIK